MANSPKNKESAELEAMRSYVGSTMVASTRANLEMRTIFIRIIRLGGLELLKKAVAEKPMMDQVKAVVDSIAGTAAVNSGTDQVSPNPTSGTTASSSKKRKATTTPKQSAVAKKLAVTEEEDLLTEKFSDDDDLVVPFSGVSLKMSDAKKGRKHITSIQEKLVHLDSE